MKITTSSSQNVFFTSDHHFGHKNIINLCSRPFENCEAMDAEMIERWNATVRPSDVVFYLGDFSLSAKAMLRVSPLLNGSIYLVPGNHDGCFPFNERTDEKKLLRKAKYEGAGFKVLNIEVELEIDGTSVLLCHFPKLTTESHGVIREDELSDHASYEPRYPEYRPTRRDRWLLHGHIHNTGKIQMENRQINVGVDVWNFFPVPWSELSCVITT